MKIAPLKINDPWFGRVMADARVQAETLRGVPVENTVEMELVELLHGGPEDNYRPYLHLRGELTEVLPSVELPYGITELAMRRGGGMRVDAFYDFSQRQLSDLVGKGYFTDAFRVPDEMTGIPWSLPGTADFMVVAPEFADQAPLVFIGVHDQSEMALDEASSGYELSAYFPDYTPVAQQTVVAHVVPAPERGGSGLDVFHDETFEAGRGSDEQAPRRSDVPLDQRASVPNRVFNRLLQEIEERNPAPIEAPVELAPEIEAEPEIVPGSPVDVYRSRVAPGVDQVLSGESRDIGEAQPATIEEQPSVLDDIPVTEDGFLDLSEPDTELAPPPVETGDAAAEAHQAAVSRRTARIRAELMAEETSESDVERESSEQGL